MKGAADHSARRASVDAERGDIVTLETYHGGQSSLAEGQVASLKPQASGLRPLRLVDYVLAIAFIIAAFLVRWPLIERGETLLHPDEAIVGVMAQDIAAGERFPIYFYGQRYMGALEAYVVAALSPLFDNQMHALRAGPAAFFALFVGVQYLMLVRWFGRAGGIIGAATLIAASPMFAQWSISARGGYIEILLWGTALSWAYWEWIVPRANNVPQPVAQASPPWLSADAEPRCGPRRKFAFGFLIGSGLWINPSILFFIVPLVLHALLDGPLRNMYASPQWGTAPTHATAKLGRASLPLLTLFLVLALNLCWSVWVEDGAVRTRLLLGILPLPVAGLIMIFVAVVGAVLLVRITTALSVARALLNAHIATAIGVLLGASPAMLYVLQHLVSGQPMESALPLGFRPLWLTGETLVYLLRGLPMMFGADPRHFVDLVTVGRDRNIVPLDIFYSALATSADRVAMAAVITIGVVLIAAKWKEIGALLSLRPRSYSPTLFLLIGLVTTVGLYVLGGCSCSFTTIRYLLPLWVFVPGLVASAFTSDRLRAAGRVAPIALCLAWGAGQVCLHEQVGAPHPLAGVARSLRAEGIESAHAEILDAHLLSYLTGQRCKLVEFEPFWPRLNHYRTRLPLQGRTPGSERYVVNTRQFDRTSDWTDGGWPGPPPPETQRFLWPALHRALMLDPTLLLDRRPLPDGYELFTLRRALPESTPTP